MKYECSACGFIYDESAQGTAWDQLGEGWECPICGVDRSYFAPLEEAATASAVTGKTGPETSQPAPAAADLASYLKQWRRSGDQPEQYLAEIQEMAISGRSVIEPMASRKPGISWDEILFRGAQLARLPRNQDEALATQTIIGPNASQPLVIATPIIISHMSFGALSREAKIALATGSAAVGTAICSGEGGILGDAMAAAHRYCLEYVPKRYSVSAENLQAVDAIEIKIGQSAKPGMGGHLPGSKVTEEIAAVRGCATGQDIISPARFPDIASRDQLRAKVEWLREQSGGRPIGIKLAAGHLEADLDVVLAAGPDFITVDGRAGATGAAIKAIKDATSIPTIYALARARRFLDQRGAKVSLIITGGLRGSADIAKALAMGADAVAIASAAMMALGCQQYRICHTGRCPVGIATQDPTLRARLDITASARRVENYLTVLTTELQAFARLTGCDDVHQLTTDDLCTTSTEIARYTAIDHVGQPAELAKN